MTVALDRPDGARPWIERVEPTHPSLIDDGHTLGELYNVVNVPTVVWIDEGGLIVRPNDVAFTSERGGKYAGVSTETQMERLRRWVVDDELPPRSGELSMPDLALDLQQARAHFGLGLWLLDQSAEREAFAQFDIAGDLAPSLFTIRRGTMPLRGVDSFGPEFAEMVQDWLGQGHRYYVPIGD